ncbi:hypothetical protein GC176_13920 [bacterium]|nr:hypothetical protein [bacterium]
MRVRKLWKLLVVCVSAWLAGSPVSASAQTTSEADGVRLIVSGTMHIESRPWRNGVYNWPDPDLLLDFFYRATAAGNVDDRGPMRWSIGADIGWLAGEPRAAEIIFLTQAMGVEWDVHAHDLLDRPLCANIIRRYGTVSNVASGLLIDEIDLMRGPLFGVREPWQAEVFWGLTYGPGHRGDADDRSYGCWRPSSSVDWDLDDPSQMQIAVGGGDRTLDGIRLFAKNLARYGASYPVTSATVNVSPVTLTVVDSDNDIAAIEVWASDMMRMPQVEWGTISETAQRWYDAGAVDSRFTP